MKLSISASFVLLSVGISAMESLSSSEDGLNTTSKTEETKKHVITSEPSILDNWLEVEEVHQGSEEEPMNDSSSVFCGNSLINNNNVESAPYMNTSWREDDDVETLVNGVSKLIIFADDTKTTGRTVNLEVNLNDTNRLDITQPIEQPGKKLTTTDLRFGTPFDIGFRPTYAPPVTDVQTAQLEQSGKKHLKRK